MKRDELINYVLASDIVKKWSWFRYHFEFYEWGLEHPFARSLVDALVNVDEKIAGFAVSAVDRLASYSGKTKYLPHYEQLLQVCSELYVFNQAVNFYKGSDAIFLYEPVAGNSKKNPEFIVKTPDFSVGIEVKQPSLIRHIQQRHTRPIQVSTRIPGFVDVIKNRVEASKITLPRDNPVKDFLISADEKFKNFRSQENFFSVLFIIWDDFIYEPISALLGDPSGLFQSGSFARETSTDMPLSFKNVDAVFIDRQLAQLLNASRDLPLLDNKKHAMDYGSKDIFPFKVVINNPVGKELPAEIEECFQVHPPSPMLGGEYISSDMIMWFPFSPNDFKKK